MSRWLPAWWAAPVLTVVALIVARPARADETGAVLAQALKGLLSEDTDQAEESAQKLASLGDPAAVPALLALCEDRRRAGPDGELYIETADHKVVHAMSGAAASPAAPLRSVEVGNTLRRSVLPVLAQLSLRSPDPSVRKAAAEELGKRGSPATALHLRKARDDERVPKVRDALALALAQLDLRSADRAERLEALGTLRKVGDTDVKSELVRLTSKSGDGAYFETDDEVRAAAGAALSAIEGRDRIVGVFRDLVHGVSLASVLLFAALGLAITFGLMGVINMAHGEMLMIGAYVTYSVQVLFETRIPDHAGLYLIAAVPLAFVVTTLVGIVLERFIIRHLYGRNLETLLATWGISLVLIQTVRLIFGAQNVAVANPSWLAGGVEITRGFVLPYNRIAVVGFVTFVSIAVWILLLHTTLGVKVRAVSQNRGMAACMGIRTRRLDAWVFGLGSGIAGLGGVALSQLGNVGPELGQAYIIDSFMVVVLGGVGKLAGTVSAAIGLGILNKLVEPFAGAVLGKIGILLLIIMFIQRHPEGLFAAKGRVEA